MWTLFWLFCPLFTAGMYVYLRPRDALFQLARARACWNKYTLGLSPSNVWEGLHKGKLVNSSCSSRPPMWECAFWRTTDDERSAYFSSRITDLNSQERVDLPFFVLAAKENNAGGRETDLTCAIRGFAWKGNELGGTIFWEWFLLQFGDGLRLSDVELSIITSDTFAQEVLDPSRVIVL